MTQAFNTGGPVGGGELGYGAGQIVAFGGGPGLRVVQTEGGLQVTSSFGEATGVDFNAASFVESERVKMLGHREAFYRCTHHDWKQYDFEGRMIAPGPPTSQPMLSAESASWYVPLRLRRPSAPYRLPRVIVNSFTSLLFGYGRWPTIRVHGDPKSDDWVNALVKATSLRTIMIRARNLGGSVGTVGLSWRFHEGTPVVQVHNGKHLYVHAWVDRERCIPAHVTECYAFPRDEFNAEKRKYERNFYWYRRDWTPNSDVVFQPVNVGEKNPQWVPDPAQSFEHNDGQCHFVWIQNLPEDDGSTEDGQPDYAELYENFETLDVIKSVIARGATLNLDPTLVLKMDPDILQRTGVKKGSDNSLVVGLDGDASYMELGGTSIQAGLELLNRYRDSVLEVAQCVIPDPNQIGSAGTSSVALKVIYEPMLAKAEVMRDQYGEGIIRLLTQMHEASKKSYADVSIDIDPETGEEREVKPFINLPPRIEMEVGENGEEQLTETEREPGQGGEIELSWGEYFTPTADDQQKFVTTLGQAVTAKIMPQESAAEEVALMKGRNALKEWAKLQKEAEAAFNATSAMFGDTGGEVATRDQLPPGAMPSAGVTVPGADGVSEEEQLVASDAPAAGVLVPGGAATGGLELTSTDMASITTVNEGRKSVGLGPLVKPTGELDPDGNLTIAEFKAKREALGEALGAAVGEFRAPKAAPEPTPTTPAAAPTNPAVQAYAEAMKKPGGA